MSVRAPTTEAIINAFTEPITSIIGRPRHADIKQFLRELKINARSVRCDVGGGQHGYVWMLEDETTWLARAGITNAAVPPTDPGACSATGTAAEREAARWLWEEAKYSWQSYVNVEIAFQKLIKENIHSDYLDELADPDEGLVDVTPLAMLTHLITRYGQITEEEIAANETILHTPFDISRSFESFIKRMQMCKSYAAEADEPITDGRLTRIAVGLIKATHLFPTPLDKWDDKPTLEKTWAAFKIHFQKAYEKHIKTQETLHAAGIANNAMLQAGVDATQTDVASLVAITNTTQDQIATLTDRISEMGLSLAAAQANNATTPPNPTPLNPTKTKDQQLLEQAALIEKLQARARNNRNNNNNHNNDRNNNNDRYNINGRNNNNDRYNTNDRNNNNNDRNNNNNDRRARTPANQDPPRAQRRFPGNRNYCWSCGFDIANKHTSLTCIFKKFGHLDTATVTNTAGGSMQQMHLLTNT
jgi:hypothetical protein